MKLNACLDMARDCGLDTYREAIANVEVHATMLFNYNEINKEISELHMEFKACGADLDDYIPDACSNCGGDPDLRVDCPFCRST